MNGKKGFSNRKTQSHIRRVLAIVLTLAMIFSLSGFPIFAEDVTDAVSEDGSEPAVISDTVNAEEETEAVSGSEVISYTADADGIFVSVDVPADALPDEAELHVTLQDEDEAVPLSDSEPLSAAAFTFGAGSEEEEVSGELDLDIFFLADDVEVEPEESAEVTIDASQALADRGCEPDALEVWHMVETEDGTEPVLVAEITDEEQAAAGIASFTVESFSEFEFHYTCSAGGWAGFGANLIDGEGNTISATVTGYDSALTGGRYTTTVDMPYTFSIEEFVGHFATSGTYDFVYATVTDPNYGDTEHEFDIWPNEEQVGAKALYGSEENPVVSVTIDGTAATENPNYNTQNVVSKTWHFTLTYEDGASVTIPIYGNADGANDNGGKYSPKYLEINLYYEEGKEAVLNLGNGNGVHSDGDYTGSSYSSGEELRYGTGYLKTYADAYGNVTLHLPSDNELDSTFTVVDAIGKEGEEGYKPAINIELGREEAYDYKLVGWINIANGEFYDVRNGPTTATINLSDDNVFYADWIGADYDRGSSSDEGLRDDTVSTADFVNIHMFDYNELFNLYSTRLRRQNGTTSEEWADSGSLYNELLLGKDEDAMTPIADSFIFQNNGTTYANSHVLSHANPMIWNLWTSNSAWAGMDEYNFVLDAKEYWNVTSPDSTILSMLYDEKEESLGVHYVGDADYLFWVDDKGYYTYDSAKSGAAYNQSEGRFYVYNDNANAFFPYNGHTDGRTTSNGLTDYWFGMSMDVNIYLPSATSAGSEESPVNQVDGEDMIFDFSGDDDIMIFMDGEMVVDMSGIHSTSYSRINFSTNTVTYSMGRDADGDPITDGSGKYYENDELNLSAGNHTMQIFYMERGGSASNLEIQFNVAPVWEYETGPVQTVTANKVWEDSDGTVIDPQNLPDVYKTNGVEVGLFDALGPAVAATDETEGTFGYTKDGTEYTVTYADDNEERHTYVYNSDGPTLTYINDEGSSVTYSKTNSAGQVVDENGYVIAWLDGETLHIRIDQQTLSDANGWYYAWELLDPDGAYEVLELSESRSYTTSSTSEGLTSYEYWSVIGDKELEEILENGENGPIILTEAAQEASTTLGDSKDALGWVIVANSDGTVTTKQVEFSQIATLEEITTEEPGGDTGESTGQGGVWHGTYGVTSQSEIEKLGDGALWYLEDAGSEHTDNDGNPIKGFYLYCQLGSETYYLALNASGDALTVTSDSEQASEFYYDVLGEFMVSPDEGENPVRVEIDDEGNIQIGLAEWEAASDDVRIYTLSDTETSGFTFTATNTFLPDFTLEKVDSTTEEPLAGVSFSLMNESGEYYAGFDETTDTVIWVKEPEGSEEPWEAPTVKTGEDGTYTFRYIPDGTYILTEIQPLDGYGALPSAIQIVVEDGTISASSFSWAGGRDEPSIGDYVTVPDEGEITFIVKNMTSAELPKTGGMGTWPFVLSGALLAGGAAFLLLRRRRVII